MFIFVIIRLIEIFFSYFLTKKINQTNIAKNQGLFNFESAVWKILQPNYPTRFRDSNF